MRAIGSNSSPLSLIRGGIGQRLQGPRTPGQQVTYHVVGGVGQEDIVFLFLHVFFLGDLEGHVGGKGAARPTGVVRGQGFQSYPRLRGSQPYESGSISTIIFLKAIFQAAVS